MNSQELIELKRTLKLSIACMSGTLSEVKKLINTGHIFCVPKIYGNAMYECILAVNRDILPSEPDDNFFVQEKLFPMIPIGALPFNSTKERLAIIDYLLSTDLKIDFSNILFFAILWNNESVANHLINKGIKLSDDHVKTITFSPETYLHKILEYSILGGCDEEIVWRLTKFSDILSGTKKININVEWLKKLSNARPVLTCIFDICKVDNRALNKFLLEVIDSNKIEILELYAECGCFKNNDILEQLIKIAIDGNKQEITLFLTNYQNLHMDFEKESKKLIKELKGPTTIEQLKKDWIYEKLDDGTIEIYRYKGEDKETIVIPNAIGKFMVSKINHGPHGDSNLFRKDKSENNKYKKVRSVHISEGISEIGYSTFNNCTNLISITIPYSVTSIGFWAFKDCASLTSITIPDSVTSIGAYAFAGCSKLFDIFYTGTIAQWNAINFGTPIVSKRLVIHCTDGDISG